MFCDADDWVDRTWLEDFCDKLPCDMVVQGYKFQKLMIACGKQSNCRIWMQRLPSL